MAIVLCRSDTNDDEKYKDFIHKEIRIQSGCPILIKHNDGTELSIKGNNHKFVGDLAIIYWNLGKLPKI